MNHPDDLTLQAWHDDALDDATRDALRPHLDACDVCAAKLRGLEALSRATDAWTSAVPALPDDFAELLAARIERERPPAPVATPAQRPPAKVVPMRRWFYPALAAAAAGILAVRVAIPKRTPGGSIPSLVSQLPVAVGDGVGGAKVTRVDVPGAQSFTVMQLQGVRPESVTAVVWIQERDEAGGSP